MFRIDDPSAAAALPTPEAAGTEGYWTEGNPGGGIAATLARASFLNMIQEELRAIVTAAGITPSKVSYNQVLTAIQTVMQRSTPMVSAAAGTADALTATFSPAVATLTNGMTLLVRAASANATTTPTFTPNSGVVTAKTIVKGNGLALAVGDIAGAGHWLELQYDLTLDKWVLGNPASSVTTHGVQRFTANGNFTVPAGVTSIYVSGCAGGGGGGNGASGSSAVGSGGSGGGAGQSIIRVPFAVVPGAVIALTIGAAGAAAGNGGNTVIGALQTLTAGSAGTIGLNVASPAPGNGGGAGFPAGGQATDCSSNNAGSSGGCGASGPFGGGGAGARCGASAGGPSGAASGFGAGGGGGGGYYTPGVGTGSVGSAGAPGLVIIEW